MSARRRSNSSSAGSKRSREPETLEKAWRAHSKHSFAGSRRAAWRYVNSNSMPPSLVNFSVGGRYYEVDPPPRPMSGPEFEKWRSKWELERQWDAAWCVKEDPFFLEAAGSSSAMAETAATAEEGEDPLFLEAVELSKKEAEEKARADAKEEAQAVATVNAFKAWESAGVVVLND